MSDLISREEALSHPFANGKYDKENANHDFILGFESYKEWLEMLPTVEDRPKGEWDINCQGIVFCSKCKKVFNHNYDIDYMESHFNFCPNCGADMRGE